MIVRALLVPIICAGLWAGGIGVASSNGKSSVVGYAYAGTLAPDTVHGAIEEFAVHSNHSLSPLKETVLPMPDVMGLAVAHTSGGISLYALDFPANTVPGGVFSTGSGSIFQYNVNSASGALTLKTPKSVGGIGLPMTGSGNNLWVYDGHGEHRSGASALYTVGCADKQCIHMGLAHFRINPRTGDLSLAAQVQAGYIVDGSLAGDHLDLLELNKQNDDVVTAGTFNPATGNVQFGSPVPVTDGSPPEDMMAWTIAASASRAAVYMSTADNKRGIGFYSVSGTKLKHIRVIEPQQLQSSLRLYAMAFTKDWLVEGEWVPYLATFAPDGSSSGLWTALEVPPYNVAPGSVDAPNYPTTIFQLGSGVYMPFSGGPLVEATDGPGGFVMNTTQPTIRVASSAMAGFLFPTVRPPVFTHLGDKWIHVGKSLRFTVSAKEVNGGVLRYSASNLPTGARFNLAAHTFAWTPKRHQVGIHRGVRFTATDVQGRSATETITIAVLKKT